MLFRSKPPIKLGICPDALIPPTLNPPLKDCLCSVKWEMIGYPALWQIITPGVQQSCHNNLQERQDTEEEKGKSADIDEPSPSEDVPVSVGTILVPWVWIVDIVVVLDDAWSNSRVP